jgi:hypothetical protein
MPFPINLESLIAAGYVFLRCETCPACREPVEVFTSPGKRELAIDPMRQLLGPAVRHYLSCNNRTNPVKPSPVVATVEPPPEPPQAPVPPPVLPQIKMYGVTDPNHQLLSAGWSDGTLVCQFAKGKGQYAGVPEDEYLKLRRARFAYRQLHTNIKGKYPYTKLE